MPSEFGMETAMISDRKMFTRRCHLHDRGLFAVHYDCSATILKFSFPIILEFETSTQKYSVDRYTNKRDYSKASTIAFLRFSAICRRGYILEMLQPPHGTTYEKSRCTPPPRSFKTPCHRSSNGRTSSHLASRPP